MRTLLRPVLTAAALLAAAGDGVTLWESRVEGLGAGPGEEQGNTASWDERAFLEMPAGALSFSPDGSLLAAGGQDLLIWDVAAGLAAESAGAQEWLSLDQADEEILSLAFAPGGRALASNCHALRSNGRGSGRPRRSSARPAWL